MASTKNLRATTPTTPNRPHTDLSDPTLPCNNIPANIIASGGTVQPLVADFAKLRYNEIFNRGVVSGRSIRLDDTYNQYYLPHIRFQGWESILNLDEPIYPLLMKLFYANLKVQRNDDNEIVCVVSAVKGVPMRLTVENVANVLGISSAGTKVFFTSHEALAENVEDIDEYYRSFTCHETDPNRSLKAADILPEFRLLRHFIPFSLLPKGGHRDEVHNLEGFILNSLVVRRRICLPYIILSAMEHTINQSRSSPNLPYGAIITQLLRAAGVNFDSGDIVVAMDKPIDKVAVAQLKGFPPSASCEGHKEMTPAKRARTEEEQGDQPDRIELQLGWIRAEMNTFFDEVRESISRTNKELRKLGQKVKRLTEGDGSENHSSA